MRGLPQRNVLGLFVIDCSMEELVASVASEITKGHTIHLVTLNPEMVAHAARCAEFLRILSCAEYRVADGIGIIAGARFLRSPLRHRLPGIEVAQALLREGEKRGWSVFLLGARKEVLKKATDTVQHKYPALRIVGIQHGYYQNDTEVSEKVRSAQPQLVLVSMGSPRQEEWIDRNRSALSGTLFVGVGGSFDVLSGIKRRSPALFRRFGLEWAWRVCSEPRRIGRVLPALLRFGWLLVRARWGSYSLAWKGQDGPDDIPGSSPPL